MHPVLDCFAVRQSEPVAVCVSYSDCEPDGDVQRDPVSKRNSDVEPITDGLANFNCESDSVVKRNADVEPDSDFQCV